ncbi:MAG: hypothetical protein QOK04_1148 [Solirubrobacteraceae bacterium]|jgi:hypothetical protein|nr:hypothetical protein [Solirubrobacteraceae bacterium]
MTHHERRRAPARCIQVIGCVAIVAAGLALSACGGSSKSAAASTTQGGNRRAAINACLKKQGITPPQRNAGRGQGPGAGGGGGIPGLGLGGGGGGGASNPNRAKLQAALRKCGLTFRGGGRNRFANNPAARQALVKFAACVRKNGYNLPAPNTSGNGPVFNASQVNQNDPKFRAAAAKCQSLLPRRPANAPPPGGPQGP